MARVVSVRLEGTCRLCASMCVALTLHHLWWWHDIGTGSHRHRSVVLLALLLQNTRAGPFVT